MIIRQDAFTTDTQVWSKLAAPMPLEAIAWRQDGRVINRDGRYFARFVCYVEAGTVRERLDAVVPGEWDLTLELLPPMKSDDSAEVLCAFKARLQVLGVIREDVGMGRDYKQASTDAFKRAAVRFGIANELYAYEQNWVEMDGDSKYAHPLEDPQLAYDRKYGKTPLRAVSTRSERKTSRRTAEETDTATTAALAALAELDAVVCPKCGGRMWDNRLTKRNPKAPDFKCRNRGCDGVIWPSKEAAQTEGTGSGEQPVAEPAQASQETLDLRLTHSESETGAEDELPF